MAFKRDDAWYERAIAEHGEWLQTSPSLRAVRKRLSCSRTRALTLFELAGVDRVARDPAVGRPRGRHPESESRMVAEVYLEGESVDVDQVLASHGLDPDRYDVVKAVPNRHQGFYKDNDGDAHIVQMSGLRLYCERRWGPAQAPVVAPRQLPRRETVADGRIQTALLIPDSQHGYRWNATHTYLEPLHDRVAFDVVLQYAEATQPEIIVLLGDMLDLAPWSTKFPRPLDLQDTTTPAIWELHWQIAQLRLACPAARILYLEGNHEKRIIKALTEKLPEATTLVGANDATPAFSIPRLLDLAALDVEYLGPYGAIEYLWDGALALTHGDVARAGGGKTATSYLSKATTSIAYGHIHTLERVSRTIPVPRGQRVVTAVSPGCLCRLVPGLVPGVKHYQDWQQGFAVARFDRQTSALYLDTHEIHDGIAVADGLPVIGRDRSAEIAEFTGYPQIAGQVEAA